MTTIPGIVDRARALQTELNEMGVGKPKRSRGTSNGNVNGNSEDRRRRRQYLVDTYRANEDSAIAGIGENAVVVGVPLGSGTPSCRCYRCGTLLTVDTVTADRIKPGCQGGTYRRENIRPACSDCNSKTGGQTRVDPKKDTRPACPTCGGRSSYRRLVEGHPCTDDRHPK